MGNFSTFYFVNFNSIYQENFHADDEIESFNYLYDKGLIEAKTPSKNLKNSILNYSKVFSSVLSENFDFLEFAKN